MAKKQQPQQATYSDAGALSVQNEQASHTELAAAGVQSAALAEVQAAFAMALRSPRNEDDAFGRVIAAAKRPSFQQTAVYRYPRGGQEIKGPSVNLAREFARAWRNVRYGFYVVSESEDTCHVRGFAWDIESNMKVEQDASFKLLVYRKKGGWQTPDERDKRELVNKHGAICERNCLLKILPRDMVEDVMFEIEKNQRQHITNDLEQHRRRVVAAFASLNVSATAVEAYVGHPLSELSPEEVLALRQIYQSIRDGNARWSEYVEQRGDKAKRTTETSGTLDSLVADAVAGKGAEPTSQDQPDDGSTLTSEPQEPDQTEVGEPQVIIDYRKRLASCKHLSELGDVMQAANTDEALTDAQFELVGSMAEERQKEIRSEKGL